MVDGLSLPAGPCLAWRVEEIRMKCLWRGNRPYEWSKQVVCIAAFVSVSLPSAAAHACSATETQVYKSAKTVWCVENSVVAQYGTFPQEFFPYGDDVVDELALLFNVPPQGVYTFEASKPSGGAHTGSECCGLGVTVTGDAFYNTAYGVHGFWGYLLSLHETINDWTGQVSSGWPTDFWADHVSAFPNAMDWHIMETLGTQNGNMNLLMASVAQKARFYPGGDTADPRVQMFDQIFALPGYGYQGLSRVFGFIEGDKVHWDALGVPNPDVKRTEYVMAYLSLGAGKPVTTIMQQAHVGDGTPDGAGDPGYVVSEADIDAIATAHCSIRAAGAQGSDETADEQALRSGSYMNVTAKGKCGAGCPAECGCQSSTDLCVAPWLADPTGSGGGAAASSTSTGPASSTSSGASGGSGTGGNGGHGGHGNGGHGGHGGHGNGNGGHGHGGKHASSGCGSRPAGDSGPLSMLAPWAVVALALGGVRRRRR